MGLLAGKVALVTGGTSGIGAASAMLFAQEGAKVAFTGRRQAEGDELAARIAGEGGEAIFIQSDVTDTAAIPATVARVVEAYGRLDVAFNNAGTGTGGPIGGAAEAEWDRVLDINAKSVFFSLQAQAEQMKHQAGGGAIVLNGSILAGVGLPNFSVYSASKGAITALTRAAAVELGPLGIRVNAVHPAVTRTPLTTRLISKGDDGAEVSPLAPPGSIPLGRFAEASDIAQAALFLLSDRASFVTGQSLFVDGGQSAH